MDLLPSKIGLLAQIYLALICPLATRLVFTLYRGTSKDLLAPCDFEGFTVLKQQQREEDAMKQVKIFMVEPQEKGNPEKLINDWLKEYSTWITVTQIMQSQSRGLLVITIVYQ